MDNLNEKITNQNDKSTLQQEKTSRPLGSIAWILAGALVALAVANGFLFFRISDMEAQVAQGRTHQAAQMEQIQSQNERLIADLRQTLDGVNQEVADTRVKAAFDVTRAKSSAQKHAEKLMNQLADQQRQQQAAVAEEIGAVKQAAEVSHAKVAEVATDVGTVRQEVAQTRSTVDSTIAELRSVRGDLGVQSGLIATNAQELTALKQTGERNYFEFNMAKAGGAQKIGGVTMRLKKADVKRNKYNLELVADDKRVEKKDKTINEPVQFYVAGSRQPLEIVVNEVRKDRIIGYLATPKTMQARR
ncbi:MAG: hypothetical protein JJE04_01320 [Acidobacteriia bacterium]|nr:hypothetical protein [Terriglobia bacterium]